MRRVLINITCVILGVVTGGIFETKQQDGQSASGIPTLDYFITDDSFSEIANAKATLYGIAARIRTELQTQRSLGLRNETNSLASEHLNSYPNKTIKELKSAADEFAGTDCELILTEDLLRAFKANGLHERWLETYLKMLYTHPTCELVATYAPDAIQIGVRLGRQNEVTAALEHVEAIPLSFPTKVLVHNALSFSHTAAFVKNAEVVARPETQRNQSGCCDARSGVKSLRGPM